MNDKIKVLHIIGKQPTGGIGALLLNLHENMDISKIQIDYLMCSDSEEGKFAKSVRELNANVYIIPELKNTRLFLIRRCFLEFFKRNNDYDIVHLHSPNISFLCMNAAKKYGINYRIVHSHNTMYSDKKINAIRNYFLCLGLKKQANIYFACSQKASEFLFDKNTETYILKNAIDCEKFRYNQLIRDRIRHELGIDNNFVVGFVGRLVEQKNPIFLVNIFKSIKEINKDAKLVIIGDGELREKIKKYVIKLGLENDVKFTGIRSDISDLMQGMDVFIMPSLFEGFGIVALEAQAAGLPTFVSDNTPDEIMITNLVNKISLNKGETYWAKEIINYCKSAERRDMTEEIKLKGFDIVKEANKLQIYYANLK